tara:strand:- start:196 stop:372 length:177 start_codon:yes stop_codon:yes gene_type:complete
MNINLDSQARKQALKDIKNTVGLDVRNTSYGVLDYYGVGISRIDTKASRRLNLALGIK